MKNRVKYNISALAKELGVTRQTVYYWIKKKWITPKRDYRNYPAFSDADLRSIKKWHRTLRKDSPLVKQTSEKRPPANIEPVTRPLTWAEIQKALYK